MIGALVVPFLPEIAMPPEGTVYVPSARTIRSPATARSIAFWRSLTEPTVTVAAEAVPAVRTENGAAAAAAPSRVPVRNVRRCMDASESPS